MNSNSYFPNHARVREAGSALVMALFFIAALLALGTTFLSVALTDRRIAANEADWAKSLHLSQAGLEHARIALDGADLDALLAGGGSLIASQSLGEGTYTVTIANNIGPRFPTALVPLDSGGATDDTDGRVVVTSTGQVRDARRATEVIMLLTDGTFKYALWAGSKMTISSSGTTNAYNSKSGPYDPSTATQEGDVFCNGEIKLSGSAQIQGDAEAVTNIDTWGPGAVTGTETVGVPPETVDPVACPATPYTPASQVPAGPGVSYDETTGKLKVSGGNNVTLTAPPAEFYFSLLELSGGSTLTMVTGGQHVDIYVSGKYVTSGGGIVNTSSKPTELTVWACGPGTDAWTLSGGSGAYMAIHAPTRKVTISGSGDLWGAIVGKEITSSGGSHIHLDKALLGSGADPVNRSWREIFL